MDRLANSNTGLRFREYRVSANLPCSLRASSRDAWLMEQGVASCRRGHVTTSQDATSSTAPDEGAAFGGRCDRAKGRGNTAWSTDKGLPCSEPVHPAR